MANHPNNLYLVIMAGGIGTRFWPISRTQHPKQFMDILGTGRTMLQQTADRHQGLMPMENVYVVTSSDYLGLVQEQLPGLALDQILLETQRRNTAPCIAYAAYKIAKKDPNATLIVVPADHVILKEAAYRTNIQTAVATAQEGQHLVTLGIVPTRPDTGYGYIQYQTCAGPDCAVKTFTEKPDLALAQAFLDSGDYVWNAGIFVFRADSFKQELERHQSRLAEQFEEGIPHYYTDTEAEFVQRVYAVCKTISVDTGIMEKSRNVRVILSDIAWSDLGTWKSLYEIQEKDAQANVVDGQALLMDSQGCIVRGPKDKLMVLQGLKDYIVVDHGQVLMICPREEEQKVKQLVEAAAQLGPNYI